MTDPPLLDPAERRTEVDRRLEMVRRVLRQRGAAACLLGSRHDFAWATLGGANHVLLSTTEGVAGVYVDARRAAVLTSVIEADRLAAEEIDELDLAVEAVPWHEADAIPRLARWMASGMVVGSDELDIDLAPLRMVLGPAEHDRLRWLGARCASAMAEALAGVTAGVREDEVAAAAVARLQEAGIRVPVVLAAADERIARFRHPLPEGRPVRSRLMLVLVAERWGLHVAATRFRELREPDDGLDRRWTAVREVQDRVHAATRPGATLGDAFDACVAAYAAAGFPDEWRAHHQGGTIGYRSRERIGVPDDPLPIRAGMAFAWNPSIAGVKVEETTILSPDGALEVATSG